MIKVCKKHFTAIKDFIIKTKLVSNNKYCKFCKKISREKYCKTDKYKISNMRYKQLESYKRWVQNYRKSDVYKEIKRKYRSTKKYKAKVNQYNRIKYRLNNDKMKQKHREYRKNEKYKLYDSNRKKLNAQNLTDYYIKKTLTRRKVSNENITPVLINIQRNFIKIHRLLKQEKNQCQTK